MGFEFGGRVALVTGGSRGIGAALARELASRGARRVIITGRDGAALAETANRHPGIIESIQFDLAGPKEVERLVSWIKENAPDLSLLVNNAGTQVISDFTGPYNAALWPDLEREIAVNFNAVIALSIGLLPVLARQSSAAIVNVTSGLALAPKKSAPVYCATKAGISAFTRSLRYQCEAALPQVRIHEALPPMVDTEMTSGRGSGKISAVECARQIADGIVRGRPVIDVGMTKLLRALMRIHPAIGHGIMRHG
jgi:uncharacterized oxidoreductase